MASQQDSGFFEISIKSLLKSWGSSEYQLSTHTQCSTSSWDAAAFVCGPLCRTELFMICWRQALYALVPVMSFKPSPFHVNFIRRLRLNCSVLSGMFTSCFWMWDYWLYLSSIHTCRCTLWCACVRFISVRMERLRYVMTADQRGSWRDQEDLCCCCFFVQCLSVSVPQTSLCVSVHNVKVIHRWCMKMMRVTVTS